MNQLRNRIIGDGWETWEEEIQVGDLPDGKTLPIVNEDGTVVYEKSSGSIFRRVIWLKKVGTIFPGHCHNFDHTINIHAGAALVRVTDKSGERKKLLRAMNRRNPSAFEGFGLIKSDTWHEIIAYEANTIVFCLFAHRGPHGEVVAQPNGMKAYI